MTRTCDDCGLPISVCNAVAMTKAAMREHPKLMLAQLAHLYPEVRALVDAGVGYLDASQRKLRGIVQGHGFSVKLKRLDAALAPFTKGGEE